MSTPSDLIKINVYRPLDGLRTPYTISLDRQRNVVSDEVDQVELERIKSNPFLLKRHTLTPDAQAQHADLLRQQGLYRHITEAGVVISREPLDDWALDFEKWIAKDQPNPFAGTDGLRMEYFDEHDAVSERVAAGDCPGCDLIRLQVTYRTKLKQQLEAAE